MKKILKSKLIFVLLVAMVFGMVATLTLKVPARAADTDCSPNGVALSGSSWLSGGGVNVCKHPGDDSANYVNNINGVRTLSGYKWECVELANRLYLTKGWTTATWYGNGNTLVNHVPAGLTKQDNGSISYVNPGDVITLDGHTYGHAGIINSIDPNGTIHIISQNADLNSSAYIDSGSLSTGNAHYHMKGWSGYTVQAIIHHPVSTPPPPPVSPTYRDLAWYDGTTLWGFKAYNYGTFVGVTGYNNRGWAGVGQYGGDTKEGIFWYDPTTGTIYYIYSGFNRGAITVRGPGVGAPVWAATGNFTGDGKRDSIVWFDGQTLYLFAGAGLPTVWQSPYSTPQWAGVADYNHLGRDDVLWYLNNGTTNGVIYDIPNTYPTNSGFSAATPVRGPGIGMPVWAGVGDFSGDGYRDALAWYDGTTLWTFEGKGFPTTGQITGYTIPYWAGVGKWKNGDTKDKLFWFLNNSDGGTTGTLYGIDDNGSGFTGAITLRGPGVGDPQWADAGNFF